MIWIHDLKLKSSSIRRREYMNSSHIKHFVSYDPLLNFLDIIKNLQKICKNSTENSPKVLPTFTNVYIYLIAFYVLFLLII